MRTYYEIRGEIVKFLNESGISPFQLIKIGKDLCSCSKCKFFVPHYLADGKLTDFGHCVKNKIPKSVRPRDTSCGFWVMDEENLNKSCQSYYKGICGYVGMSVTCDGCKARCQYRQRQ